ncbi:MAG: leucyl/phenylalanyl-tRNA--protein transferase [Calditrichaeota bacterium]|nr:MAG: leucyl/phenylalanyl-tRNA--protein transferase [Calditrichota bacterium]
MPVYRIPKKLIFPHSTSEKEDITVIGDDLRPNRLLLAYSCGFFPWPWDETSPLPWVSPATRLILLPQKLHIPRRTMRIIRQGKFTVTFDQSFDQVIQQCAKVPRRDQDGTWITSRIISAYIRLHEMGFAHSVETRFHGELVGGIYGISLGGAFFGESMFHLQSDASKVAMAHLIERLQRWNFDLLDAQITSTHMLQLGAHEVSRAEYLRMLDKALQKETHRGNWSKIADLQ